MPLALVLLGLTFSPGSSCIPLALVLRVPLALVLRVPLALVLLGLTVSPGCSCTPLALVLRVPLALVLHAPLALVLRAPLALVLLVAEHRRGLPVPRREGGRTAAQVGARSEDAADVREPRTEPAGHEEQRRSPPPPPPTAPHPPCPAFPPTPPTPPVAARVHTRPPQVKSVTANGPDFVVDCVVYDCERMRRPRIYSRNLYELHNNVCHRCAHYICSNALGGCVKPM